jgi:hypothetical protein
VAEAVTREDYPQEKRQREMQRRRAADAGRGSLNRNGACATDATGRLLRDSMTEVGQAMLKEINAKLEGIGECACIEPWEGARSIATIYLPIDFNDSTRVAGWFHDLGATGVVIEHTLFCDFNGDRDGFISATGSKAWSVTFLFDGEIS